MTDAIGDDRVIRINDCTGALEVLSRNDVFPDGTIERWQPQYYTRKEGRFLLQEGIIFDDGLLSELYIESDSEGEAAKYTLDSEESEENEESETDTDGEADSDGEGDSGSEAESD